MSGLVYQDGTVDGVLPNGEIETFDSMQDYEDAYWDMYCLMNNEFELDIPEYA